MRTNRKKTCLVAAGMILAAVTVAFAAFFQGFEFNTDGWFGATRVMSATNGVPSKTGGFHAEDGTAGRSLAGAATARRSRQVGIRQQWTSISTFPLHI